MAMPGQNRLLDPSQLVVEYAGVHWRHVIVMLHGDQSVPELREKPELWKVAQASRNVSVRAGDKVTVISPDGCEIADSCVVTRAQGGSVWLGKPLRLIALEPQSLFSDGMTEVVPAGTGFSLRNVRSGRTDDAIFATAEAARVELEKRKPKRVA